LQYYLINVVLVVRDIYYYCCCFCLLPASIQQKSGRARGFHEVLTADSRRHDSTHRRRATALCAHKNQHIKKVAASFGGDFYFLLSYILYNGLVVLVVAIDTLGSTHLTTLANKHEYS
jgi:hypothetical protein